MGGISEATGDQELIPARHEHRCHKSDGSPRFGVILLPAEDGRCCSKFGLTKMSSDEVMGRFSLKNEAEIGQLLEKAIPENTCRSTLMWVTTINAFCREQGLVIDLAKCSPTELNNALCKFNAALRTKKGKMYKKASYFAARAAIHRPSDA